MDLVTPVQIHVTRRNNKIVRSKDSTEPEIEQMPATLEKKEGTALSTLPSVAPSKEFTARSSESKPVVPRDLYIKLI